MRSLVSFSETAMTLVVDKGCGITSFFMGMIPLFCAHKSISSQTASPAAAAQSPSTQA